MSDASADRAVTLIAPMGGWLAPLDEVPDPVFAQRMMGDGVAVDPVEGTLHAPADCVIVSVPRTAHAVTLRLANGAEVLIHIGLETVALDGKGFTAHVREGDEVQAGTPLLSFDLDAVAEGAVSLVTPIVVASEGYRFTPERPGRPVGTGERIGSVEESAPPGEAGAATDEGRGAGEQATRRVTLRAPHGIHARPAARIGAVLKPYAAQVALSSGKRRANARSTVALLGLGARKGDEVAVTGEGDDAEAAVTALAAFLSGDMGDTAGAASVPPSPSTKGGPVRAAPGLALGTAVQLRAADRDVPENGAGIAQEEAALERARAEVVRRLEASGLSRDIAEAHRALLDDPELQASARRHIAEGRSAAFAWRAASMEARAVLRDTGDALLAERAADITDLERQLVDALLGKEDAATALPALPRGCVLIAPDVLPSEFQALDLDRVVGICTAFGGPTAHVAILAASAGLPMLVAAGEEVLTIPEGTPLVLDADNAELVIDPDSARMAQARAAIAEQRERRAAERETAQAPAALADGTRIEVFANLGSVEDAARAVEAGAEGCGLLRTEFLFLDREAPPDMEEQARIYGRIATILGDRPLILRALDIGGDKPVSYLPMAAEPNPALGLRGIRLLAARPDLFETQLRAMLAGVPARQCRIMLPMVVDPSELREARDLLERLCEEAGTPVPPLGVMVETPAAAMLSDRLCEVADFLSVGTNDLTQYTLACDRGNAAVSDKVDALHPAVLRLIGEVGRGAAAGGRWAGVCGGLAADPLAAPILVGLGMTELSAPPAAIPALKAALRRFDMAACSRLAEAACAASTSQEVQALAKEAQP